MTPEQANSLIGSSIVVDGSVSVDEEAMRLALRLAEMTGEHGEVPVGALVVIDNKIVGVGWNQPIGSLDPSAHAEMVAIRSAARHIGNYRLPESTLYVTLEPCTMCFGALVHSRIERLVYGAKEPKAGVIESTLKLPESPIFNHTFQVQGGICESECSSLLSNFFARRRASKKRLRAATNVQSSKDM